MNGSVSVIICGIKSQTNTAAPNEAKNNNQYKPLDLFDVSMRKKICRKNSMKTFCSKTYLPSLILLIK